MGISFRPFNGESDSGLISRFLVDAKELGGNPHEDPQKDCAAYIEHVAAAQARDPGFAAMMLDDGEVIGFVHCFPVKAKPEVGFLTFDYLVPERRGKGLGAHLMDYAVRTLKPCGCGRIALEASKNNAMAIAFYRKHGFETVKERDGILVMRKRI
jgi:ribosomal protein S18 acetylase RimI-like enzyme